jgi:uncharacterized membrane protein
VFVGVALDVALVHPKPMNYLLIGALGGCTGLRTMTPIAVLCWFAYRNVLHFAGWRSFTASLVAVIIFSLMALGEYVGDKLPTTPSRTKPVGLIARSLFAGFVGLLLAQVLVLNPLAAVIVGIAGALIGAFAGWFVRTRAVAALKCPDWPVAAVEDVIAIGLSITLMHLVAVHAAMFAGNEGLYLK